MYSMWITLTNQPITEKTVATISNQQEYYLFQDQFENPKIIKIQEVHQKIHTKQFLLLYLNCFLLATHLNLKRLDKRD